MLKYLPLLSALLLQFGCGPSPGEFVSKAEMFTANGELDKAYEAYSAAIAIEPQDPELYQLRARISWRQARYAAAITDLSEALEVDPSSAPILVERGRIYLEMEKLDLAEKDIEAALKLGTPSVGTRIAEAKLRIARMQLDEALAALDSAIAADKSNALAFWLRYEVYDRLGNEELAVADRLAAEKLDPSYTVGKTSGGMQALSDVEGAGRSRILNDDPLSIDATD